MEIKYEYRQELNKLHPYTYHITHKKYLEDIKNYGLKPLCGERSRSINDYLEAIYFYLFFQHTYKWADLLYKKEELFDVKVLRINIQGIGNIQLKNLCLGECYTLEPIDKEYIELLDSSTTAGEIVTADNVLTKDEKSLIWKPI